ncbi:MAG: GNAT family N-acetyltransferase [Caldilineaceae bacterium]
MPPALPTYAMPTLTTTRLRLTSLWPETDRDAYFHMLADAEVVRYLDLDPMTTVSEADELLESLAQRIATGDNFHWAMRPRSPDGNGLIGSCNLTIDRGRRRAELGYYLARPWWGQGLGKEAAQAVVDFGFLEQGLNRIEAIAYAENLGSHALLRSVGFQQEGVLREHAWEHGRYWDDMMFGLLRREWEPGYLARSVG